MCSVMMKLEHVLTYLRHYFVMTIDVFFDDEAGARFGLPYGLPRYNIL
jgi:hypothetical protein